MIPQAAETEQRSLSCDAAVLLAAPPPSIPVVSLLLERGSLLGDVQRNDPAAHVLPANGPKAG
jgi:hypothetical protein